MTVQILEAPVPQADAADWWRGAVVYQVYPRSFADSNGDGVGLRDGGLENLDGQAQPSDTQTR